MRTLVGLALGFTLAAAAFGQYRTGYSNPTPYVTGGFGSVVFPAGTPATNPGLTRITPNVLYPGGGGPRLVVPNANAKAARAPAGGSIVYSYPVYVGSYGSSFDASGYGAQPAQGSQQQPNITIVMPPQQPPVIINQYDEPPHSQMSVYQPEPAPAAQADDSAPEPSHYLLAFNDHTIYSAIAYWVDGDTLHYFTSGNTHNQVSVSLIDRAMTERLNKDSGMEVKLPAAK